MKFFKNTEKREQFKKFVAKDPSFLKKIVGGDNVKPDGQTGDQNLKI